MKTNYLMIAALVLFGASVSATRQAPRTAAPRRPPATSAPAARTYVGSLACKECHAAVYQRWSKTRMANVVTDPKLHPEVVIPDFSKADPQIVKFTLSDVAFVYGTKWKQRYFTKVGNDYFPLGAQWDITNKKWLPYHVPDKGGDWWAEFYPTDNMKRPTGPLCDGCHSVNYNIRTKTVTEWNVGCERCHGPGSEHVKNPTTTNIANPAKLDYVHAVDTCIQCHSQGRPAANPIDGKYYDWPVGFVQGVNNLADYWLLEDHKLGETSFTHFPDGTAHKNRMQGNDFVQSVMYRRGITCFSCHDVHGTSNNADLIKPVGQLCLTCHGPQSPNGPHAASIEAHTHHPAGSSGSECVNCHMPKIEQELGDVNVRSHTFKFITPEETDLYKIPNACTGCHTGKTTAWARESLKAWGNVSPWRDR